VVVVGAAGVGVVVVAAAVVVVVVVLFRCCCVLEILVLKILPSVNPTNHVTIVEKIFLCVRAAHSSNLGRITVAADRCYAFSQSL
jgi:hypothetical protein